MPEQNTSVMLAVTVALGGLVTGLSRYFLGARRVDKVDAVTAIAAAYDKVAERTSRHVDDLSDQLKRTLERVDYLERELRKRDELIYAHIAQSKHAG